MFLKPQVCVEYGNRTREHQSGHQSSYWLWTSVLNFSDLTRTLVSHTLHPTPLKRKNMKHGFPKNKKLKPFFLLGPILLLWKFLCVHQCLLSITNEKKVYLLSQILCKQGTPTISYKIYIRFLRSKLLKLFILNFYLTTYEFLGLKKLCYGFKDGNTRFATIPLNALSGHV